MASDPDVHPATLRFQLALPKAVQSASPALAALHVTRSRLIHSPHTSSHTFDTTHCTACGTYLLEGTGSVRVMRKRAPRKSGKPYLRVLRKSCAACGQHQDVSIEESDRPITAVDAGKRDPLSASVSQLTPGLSSGDVSIPKLNRAVRKPSPLNASVQQPGSSSTQLPESITADTKPIAAAGVDRVDRSKPRVKKKAGLSDMLARNKERQEKERSTAGSTGLAAFLQDL